MGHSKGALFLFPFKDLMCFLAGVKMLVCAKIRAGWFFTRIFSQKGVCL